MINPLVKKLKKATSLGENINLVISAAKQRAKENQLQALEQILQEAETDLEVWKQDAHLRKTIWSRCRYFFKK